MDNILITGSTGFVGSNLIPYLKKQYTVIGVSRREGTDAVISYDNLNAGVWNDSFAMIHLAGKAHDLKKTSNDQEYFEVNTELTKKLFDQFIESSASVFIFISSVKAAADSVDTILNEDIDPTPETPYGKSKLAAENYLLSKKLPKGKKLYILRPCMIHGEGNKGNLNLLYKVVKKGIPYPLGNFENQRSFLSVENLCFVIKNLFEKLPESGIYNVSDDVSLSTTDLIKLISETLQKKPRILNIPKGLLLILAKTGSILRLPFNDEKLGKLTENYVVSNQKIKKALGAELPINSRSGLIKTIQSFKETA